MQLFLRQSKESHAEADEMFFKESGKKNYYSIKKREKGDKNPGKLAKRKISTDG